MYWTCDLGNSALKLCTFGAPGDREPRLALELPGDDAVEALRERLPDLEAPRGIAFSSVAGLERTEEVAELLAGYGELTRSTDARLENRSTRPETVGADRLCAALGALSWLPDSERAAIVLDVGTAMTVDLVLRADDGSSLVGAFVGGAIAPGPRLLARALGAGGARLPEVDPFAPGALPALGRDTAEALRSGVVHGLRGAALELARSIADEAGLAEPPCLFCGGAAALVAPTFRERWPGSVDEVPGLVHLGLLRTLA